MEFKLKKYLIFQFLLSDVFPCISFCLLWGNLKVPKCQKQTKLAIFNENQLLFDLYMANYTNKGTLKYGFGHYCMEEICQFWGQIVALAIFANGAF